MSIALINSFGRNVTVQRGSNAGEYVDGYFVEPSRQDIEVKASVQNLSAKEVLLLPEGDRQKEWKKLYSTFEFKVQKQDSIDVSDYVLIDGKTFMVVKVANYTDHNCMSITYYRADIVSVNT